MTLEIIGLDADAQAVYEVLVDNPPTTVDDLQRQSGLDGATLSRLLERLDALGLATLARRNPPTFTATAPDVALEVLLLEQQARLKRARLYAEHLSGRYLRAAAGWDAVELIEVITGQEAVAQRVEQVLRSTTDEICFIDKHPYVVAPQVIAPVEAQMLDRGVSYRALYDTAGLATRRVQAEIEPAIERGEQARVLPEAPVKLVLSDKRRALLPLQSSPTMIENVIAVHSSALLDALNALFETLWRTAVPLPTAGKTTGSKSVTLDEARLISLLTAGLPDQTIARQLGLSYRTLQRRLSALIESLGARTRFQAGLQAAFHGLVPDPSAEGGRPPPGPS